MAEKRLYMMAPFRSKMDDDIRDKYFAIPEGKRSDVLRDAFRLYCGIDHKLVFEAKEMPIKQPTRPPFVQREPTVHTPVKQINRPLMNPKK